MNKVDQELIKLLRVNGRESVANLAIALGVSRATIRAHMDKLYRDGQIVGYTVQLREDVTPQGVRALTMIAIEGHGAQKITAQIYSIPSVQLVHSTNGKWDLVVELMAEDLASLDTALTTLREIEGIAASETSIILATRFPSTLKKSWKSQGF